MKAKSKKMLALSILIAMVFVVIGPDTTRAASISVQALCSKPHDYYGIRIKHHIDVLIRGYGISTSPDGVWTLITDVSANEIAYLDYHGPSASYTGADLHGFVFSIRGGNTLWFESGRTYLIQIIRAPYSGGKPSGQVVAQTSFSKTCKSVKPLKR